MNINKTFLLLFPVICMPLGTASASGGAHADPMSAISSRGDSSDTPAKTAAQTPRAPSRHFSPLDAMNGKIVVKHQHQNVIKTNHRNSITNKTAQERENVQSRTSSIDYLIEDVERSSKPSTHPVSKTHPISALPKGDQTKQKKSVPANDIARHLKILDDIGSESPNSNMIKTLTNTAPATMKHALPHTGGQKILYLTFDDGPCGGTANLLRLIKKEGISVTMFNIGRNVVRNRALFDAAVRMPNILIANHTYTHANGHYRRFYGGAVSKVVDDIDKAQMVVGGAKYLRLCGRNVWRLPNAKRDDYGIKSGQRSHEVNKYDALAARGYFIYGWDVEWHFSYKNQRPLFGGSEMARRVNMVYSSKRLFKRGRVVLLAHDFMWRHAKDIRQLKIFIDIMKAEHWKFETIDSYIPQTPAVFVRDQKSINKTGLNAKATRKLVSKTTVLPPSAIAPLTNNKNITPPQYASLKADKIPANISTQLSRAIQSQNFVLIRKLLAQGADINGKDSRGEIPLNIAIRTNNAVLVKMLVERGAHIFNMDSSGMSPMGIAKQNHNTIIIRYLQKKINIRKKRRLKNILFAQI